MTKPIALKTQRVHVHAPRQLCFEVVASAGRVVKEVSDGTKIVRFDTAYRGRTITTMERVSLQPPEHISYEWIEGPLQNVRERITFDTMGPSQTDLVYEGSFESSRAWPVRLWIKRVYDRLVREHLMQAKELSERRAERSRVYRSAP